MRKTIILSIFVVAIFVAGFFLWNGLKNSNQETSQQASENKVGSQVDENALVRSNEGGSVSMDVTFENPVTKEKDSLVFEVAMNTHSVNLDTYDLAKLAVLKTSDGREFTNFTKETQGMGHHKTISLKIKNKGIITPKTKSLTLVLKDVAGVPSREFNWERQYLSF